MTVILTVSPALDDRFRAAAAESGLLDVAYDVVDSPLGPLFVAASEAGVCRIGFDAEPERHEEELARGFGLRVLRSPRAVDPARRELAEYFEGRRREFDLQVDLRPLGEFHRAVLDRLATVPYGRVTTYGALAAEAGRPRAARAVGTVMNRNPIPIVLPCHRVIGSTGKLVGYGGGLERKIALLELEGVAI
jgi:methylated-DNA-[protein]-cysteine S-methyltransferase